MMTLRKYLSLACILVASLFVTTPLMAGASDFTGLYLQMGGSFNGGELSGEYIDNDGQITKGTGGKVFPTFNGEIGFNLGLGEVFVVSVGTSLSPTAMEISRADDATDQADMNIIIEDIETFFIAPGFSFGENSLIYLKWGNMDADLRCTAGKTCPSGLDGDLYGIGTIAKFGTGLFVRTEAGVTDYGDITITNVGSSGGNGTLRADPNQAYGSFAIGYNF